MHSSLRPSLFALLAAAAFAGCTIYNIGGDDSPPPDPDPFGTCVRDTIAQCYLDQLSADACAELVIASCTLGEQEPIDAGIDAPSDGGPPPPVDTDCLQVRFQSCYALLGNTQLCAQKAIGSCVTTCSPPLPACWPPCAPSDPWCVPECEPGDPTCRPSCDYPGDPTCEACAPGDAHCLAAICHYEVARDCRVNGGDESECEALAVTQCGS